MSMSRVGWWRVGGSSIWRSRARPIVPGSGRNQHRQDGRRSLQMGSDIVIHVVEAPAVHAGCIQCNSRCRSSISSSRSAGTIRKGASETVIRCVSTRSAVISLTIGRPDRRSTEEKFP